MTPLVHEPVWPDGTCRPCGVPWPCERAVAELAEYGTGLPLAAAVWRIFDEAAQAVPAVPLLVLYERCIRRPLAAVDAGTRTPA